MGSLKYVDKDIEQMEQKMVMNFKLIFKGIVSKIVIQSPAQLMEDLQLLGKFKAYIALSLESMDKDIK